MRIDTLQKLINEKRAELAKLETAHEVLAALSNGHKLDVMDRAVRKMAAEPVVNPEKPKRRTGGFPPGYRHSAKTKAKLRAARLATVARKRGQQAVTKRQDGRAHAQNLRPDTSPFVPLQFDLPEPLTTTWREDSGLPKQERKKLVLAVVKHLGDAHYPTDWPTIRSTIHALGWPNPHKGMVWQAMRWKSLARTQHNGIEMWSVTSKGERRLRETEKVLARKAARDQAQAHQ